MAIKEVLSDNRSQTFPFPASTAVSVGDLLTWNDGALVAKPANARADKGSKALNQADFRTLFLGVAADQRLSTETSTGNDSRRLVIIDGIFDCDCASATFEVGDLIGIDRDATPLNMNQQVIKVATPNLAIGFVTKREPSAVTKVRCRLTSSLMYGLAYMAGKSVGGNQGQGATTLADGAATLTVDANPYLNMVPTAARNVTLPAEAQSKGLEFYFTNNSAGANTVTFLASGGGGIKGNGACPQNKTIHLWCDGTNWNGLVSA